MVTSLKGRKWNERAMRMTWRARESGVKCAVRKRWRWGRRGRKR